MSNPSFDNIDKWLFEYTEGNLSSQQVDQLKQFMQQNPEFDLDFDAWESAKVEANPVVFPNIDSYTKKPIAWIFPAAIVGTLGLSIGMGWLALNKIENDAHVESVARVNEINYVKKLKNNTSSKDEKVSSEETTINTSANTTAENFIALSNSNLHTPTKLNVNPVQSSVSFIEKEELISTRSFLALKAIEEKHKVNELVAESLKESKNEILRSEIEKINTKKASEEKFVNSTNSESTQISSEESIENARAMSRSNQRISSNYNKSFSSKVKSTIRKIIRMTDNPIALTNSKDIYYHTPGMQTLDVNFGSVGSLLQPRIQTVSRAQWTGHGNQQIANQISFDSYVKDIRGGIGVQLNHVYYGDGAYQLGQFALMYSPKFAVSKNVVIEPAIRFKMGNKRLYNQKLVPGQLIEVDRLNQRTYANESLSTSVQDLWYKDVGFALMSNTKWFSAGIQIDNIGRHYSNVFQSSDKNNYASQHITATIGTDYVSRSKIISFSPYIMYQKMENLSEIWGGSNFRYKKFMIGGGISSIGDYAGSIGIKTDRLMITYAVDNTQSVLLDKKLFSQQLTLRILTNRGSNSHRMLK
jgi:hypothetical protein